MYITRLGLLGLTVLVMIIKCCPQVQAAQCWNLSPAGFNFGTVTAGEKAETNTTLQYSCNNPEENPKYVRLCLNLTNVDIPQMNMNPPTVPLSYLLYRSTNLRGLLGKLVPRNHLYGSLAAKLRIRFYSYCYNS